MAAADNGHYSSNKCEDSVKPHHGIVKSALTLVTRIQESGMGKRNRKRLRQQNPMLFGQLARQCMLSPCLLKV
jgi:hypothetical protein